MDKDDEGLGTVYEKIMLNDFFCDLIKQYKIKTVLEMPARGMSGIPGMNSFEFARRKCQLTILDNDKDRIAKIQKYWQKTKFNPNIIYKKDFRKLPYKDNSFDLVWNFSALWYHDQADQIIKEMVRVSKKLVFISVTNKKQIGYFLRKRWLDKEFFNGVYEKWTDPKNIKTVLSEEDVKIIDEGVIDVPPFPDTCMPLGDLLKKIGFKSRPKKNDKSWCWSTMEYYQGGDKFLPAKIAKYSFLEKLPLPWQTKIIWAHHRFILGKK